MQRWFERIFLIPFLLIGIGTIVMAYYSWTMLVCPGRAEGTITGHERKWDSESSHYLHFLKFEFDRNGKTDHSRSCVSVQHYNEIRDGAKWPVFYSTSVPNSGAELDLPERRNMGYFFAPFITLFALFWNAISWTVFLMSFKKFNPDVANSDESAGPRVWPA